MLLETRIKLLRTLSKYACKMVYMTCLVITVSMRRYIIGSTNYACKWVYDIFDDYSEQI